MLIGFWDGDFCMYINIIKFGDEYGSFVPAIKHKIDGLNVSVIIFPYVIIFLEYKRSINKRL